MLTFAKEHVNKPLSFWEKVVFADESKFRNFGIKGLQMVRRKSCLALNIANLSGTVNHGGGGIIVWGCMEPNGVAQTEFLH